MYSRQVGLCWRMGQFLLDASPNTTGDQCELSVGRERREVKVSKLYSASTRSISKALRYSTRCQGITQLYRHTLHFIRKRNEPYLPLHSQPQLVLIYRPRRDGRLSRPWCEVAPAGFEPATSRLQIRHSTTQPLAHLNPVEQTVCLPTSSLSQGCMS